MKTSRRERNQKLAELIQEQITDGREAVERWDELTPEQKDIILKRLLIAFVQVLQYHLDDLREGR